MGGPDCRRVECKDNRAEKWKAKCASAARNRRNRSRRKENGSCPSNENQESKQRRSRKSNNRRNRKRFVRQTRSRPPRNRALQAGRHNRRRDRPNRTAKCRRAQFSRITRGSSSQLPKEIDRRAEAVVSPVAGENLRRARLDRQQAAEKMKRRE